MGGMPQSVMAYLEHAKGFSYADGQKRQILTLYRDNVHKAARRYRARVSAVFENIPGFLSTHEKRIVLRQVEPGVIFGQKSPLAECGCLRPTKAPRERAL